MRDPSAWPLFQPAASRRGLLGCVMLMICGLIGGSLLIPAEGGLGTRPSAGATPAAAAQVSAPAPLVPPADTLADRVLDDDAPDEERTVSGEVAQVQPMLHPHAPVATFPAPRALRSAPPVPPPRG